MNLRLNEVYIRICDEYVEWFDDLETNIGLTDAHDPWTHRSATFTELLSIGTPSLRAKVTSLKHHFTVVALVFHADPAQRVTVIEQLGTLPSAAAKTAAARLARLARIQYSRLADDDPRKKIADDWNEVLEKGDLLRNPAAGSPAEAVNIQLALRTKVVKNHVEAQKKALSAQFPDADQAQQHPYGVGLQDGQPQDRNRKRRRSGLDEDSEQLFKRATGFRTHQDPVTGLTQVEAGSAQQNTQQPGQYAPAPAQPPVMPAPDALPDAQALIQMLDTNIAMSTALLNSPAAASDEQNVFGQAAAIRALALQNIEALLKQREAALAFAQDGDADRFQEAMSAAALPPMILPTQVQQGDVIPPAELDDAEVQDPAALAGLRDAGFLRALPPGSQPDGQPDGQPDDQSL